MAAPCVDVAYTSFGCNKRPFSADWGINGLICFCCQRSLALYQPEIPSKKVPPRIISSTCSHSDKVNCVQWIHNDNQEETELVCGAADGSLTIWKVVDQKFSDSPECVLRGHEGPVTYVLGSLLPPSSHHCQDKDTIIISASTDSTVRIWDRKAKDGQESQVLKFGSGFALALGLHFISSSNVPLLACGCDHKKIDLYTRASQDQKFEKVLALSGHDDWVRDLDFISVENGDILLASCAQDNLIRVWKISQRDPHSQTSSWKSVSELSPNEDITVKETHFSFHVVDKELRFAVSLESVLWGHENRVYSVRWHRETGTGQKSPPKQLKLLSASMDKTMILWCPETSSGMWMEQVRVGDVGGNSLGFFGGLFSPCGQSIIAHGYQGAFSQWSFNTSTGVWEPQVTSGGHYDSVVDLAWSRGQGHFLLTASTDQTTRLHAPWVREGTEPTWCEIARPQVHGYDLNCMTALNKYAFASGADEKLIRMFSATRNFVSNFCQTCCHSTEKELGDQALPEGANVPALGLSNKAVFTGGQGGPAEEPHKMGQYPENYFSAIDLQAPPTEDHLLQNTLWPEDAKLYGHGYEIFALAAHPNGTLLASACKASKADAAAIFLWNIVDKKQVGTLSACTLTVTQMAFSHDGAYLLAVSRDRSWAVFHCNAESGAFTLAAVVDKRNSAHSRIIWSCDWSHDDKFFFTASRDKKVLVWSLESVLSSADKTQAPAMAQTLSDSVTAVCSAPVSLTNNRYLVATGLDSGPISLHAWNPVDTSWMTLTTLTQCLSHHMTVNRLAFRPCRGRVGHGDPEDSHWLQLASCGADHAVRVYNLDLGFL